MENGCDPKEISLRCVLNSGGGNSSSPKHSFRYNKRAKMTRKGDGGLIVHCYN